MSRTHTHTMNTHTLFAHASCPPFLAYIQVYIRTHTQTHTHASCLFLPSGVGISIGIEYDDVTYVYDDVTYVYDDVTYSCLFLPSSSLEPVRL